MILGFLLSMYRHLARQCRFPSAMRAPAAVDVDPEIRRRTVICHAAREVAMRLAEYPADWLPSILNEVSYQLNVSSRLVPATAEDVERLLDHQASARR